MAIFSDRYCHVPWDGKRLLGKRENLLWPVYAWKVLYPDDRQQPGCNLFQETILGLLRAGITDTLRVAQLMAIDSELVRFIIASQLQPNGWLDQRLKVTPVGEKLLDEAEDHRLSLTVGYAFQDAVSGKWLPRFSIALPEIAPVERDQNNRPIFILDRDKGIHERPFLLQARAPARGDLSELLSAYRQYRHEISYARSGAQWSEFEVCFQSIESIDDVPAKIYLWCELYRDEIGPQRWLISDPFRIRPAVSWLREPFLALARNHDELTRRMQRLLPEVSADGLLAEEWFERLAERAEFEIESTYRYLKDRAPLVREHLLRVLRQKAKIEDSALKVYSEDLGALMTESASLIEAVLKWILNEWQAEPCWPTKGNWTRSEAIEELQALSVRAINDGLVRALAGQTRRSVANAMTSRDQPLKALLAGSLFAASSRNDHPFHQLAPEQLRLEQLPQLADYRNRVGGHASGELPDRETVLKHAEFAIEWMALFEPWY